MNNEMRIARKFISCPVCGSLVCKCVNGMLETECSKCKNIIVANVKNEQVLIFRSRRSKERR